MSNGTSAQSQFNFQRPPGKIYRVGPAGSNMFFTSIQAAIDAAVADGHTSNDNPAAIEVSPGRYTEDLVLATGVSLYGQVSPQILNADGTGGFTVVEGNMTFPVSNVLSRNQNSISIMNMAFTCLNGVTLTLSGTGSSQINFYESIVQKQAGGDANPAFALLSTNANARVRFRGTLIDYNIAGVAMDLQGGVTAFRNCATGVFSSNNSTLVAVATLQNNARLDSDFCDFFFVGNATDVFDIQAAAAQINIFASRIVNNLVGGNIFWFSAAGNGRAMQSMLQLNNDLSGYVAAGAAGTYLEGSNAYSGTNRQVQDTLTVFTLSQEADIVP